MQSMMGQGGMMGQMPITGTMPMSGTAPAANPSIGSGVDGLTAETKTEEAGGVTVEITPLNLKNSQAAALNFAVAMNTHSVNLGVDLTKLPPCERAAEEVAATHGRHRLGVAITSRAPWFSRLLTPRASLCSTGATTVTLAVRDLAGVHSVRLPGQWAKAKLGDHRVVARFARPLDSAVL